MVSLLCRTHLQTTLLNPETVLSPVTEKAPLQSDVSRRDGYETEVINVVEGREGDMNSGVQQVSYSRNVRPSPAPSVTPPMKCHVNKRPLNWPRN